MLQVAIDLGAERGRKGPFGDIGDAELGGDREAGRNGEAEVGHFGKTRAFPAQNVTHRGRAVGAAVAEEIDMAFNGHTRNSRRYRYTAIVTCTGTAWTEI